jgi:hypothetical protein
VLDVADLHGRELEVEDDQVDVLGFAVVPDLFELARADAGGGVNVRELLRDRSDRLGARALSELKQLRERRLGVILARIDLDQQGAGRLLFGDS